MNFHNPRNLPSPGEPPWRFILTSELECLPKDAQVWDNLSNIWEVSRFAGKDSGFRFFNYRTKTPLPE